MKRHLLNIDELETKASASTLVAVPPLAVSEQANVVLTGEVAEAQSGKGSRMPGPRHQTGDAFEMRPIAAQKITHAARQSSVSQRQVTLSPRETRNSAAADGAHPSELRDIKWWGRLHSRLDSDSAFGILRGPTSNTAQATSPSPARGDGVGTASPTGSSVGRNAGTLSTMRAGKSALPWTANVSGAAWNSPISHASPSAGVRASDVSALSDDLGIQPYVEAYTWQNSFEDYLNSVGNPFQIFAFGSMPMTSVTWEVDGGIDPSTYSFTYQNGHVDRLPTSVTVNHPISTYVDSYYFMIDEVEGVHNITATATFEGGGSGSSNTIYVTVQKPNVDWFKGTYQGVNKVVATDIQNGQEIPMIGIGNKGPNPTDYGQLFQAKVDLPSDTLNFGGRFAFLQLVKPNRTIQYRTPDGQGRSESLSSEEYVLDARPNVANSPLYNEYKTQVYSAGVNDVLVGGGAVNSDSPAELVPIPNYSTGDYANRIIVNDSFKTYLMFQSSSPNASAWVAVSMIEWTFSGGLEYTGAEIGNIDQYGDPAHWSLVADPFDPQNNIRQGGAPDTPFPEWDKAIADLAFVED